MPLHAIIILSFFGYLLSTYFAIAGARIVNKNKTSIGKIEFRDCLIPAANTGICVLLVVYFPCRFIKNRVDRFFSGPIGGLIKDVYLECQQEFQSYKA